MVAEIGYRAICAKQKLDYQSAGSALACAQLQTRQFSPHEVHRYYASSSYQVVGQHSPRRDRLIDPRLGWQTSTTRSARHSGKARLGRSTSVDRIMQLVAALAGPLTSVDARPLRPSGAASGERL